MAKNRVLMKKVYISGKISELPIAEVKEKFENAAIMVEQMGHIAVSPFSNGLSDDAPWESHMVKDIEMLLGCDAILMLPCWKQSRGARIEKHIADVTKKVIYELDVRGESVGFLQPYFDEVINVACSAAGVNREVFYSKNRSLNIVRARMIVTNELTTSGIHATTIASLLKRDRSTILYYRSKYNDECCCPPFYSMVKQVKQSLNPNN